MVAQPSLAEASKSSLLVPFGPTGSLGPLGSLGGLGFLQGSVLVPKSQVLENDSTSHEIDGQGIQPQEPVVQETRVKEKISLKATLQNGKIIELHWKDKKKTSLPETTDKSLYAGVPIYNLISEVRHQKSQPQQELPSRPTKAEDTLLSDKWRPKRWRDLGGMDKLNRAMLRWLTAWTKVVQGDMSLVADSPETQHLDALGRPRHKLLLLHGPPGVGKTTVAHVLARQAGYDVLEINASDERSRDVVKNKIHSAIHSHRVASSRPVCIVADEIEGASESGFIRAIVDLVVTDQRALAAMAKNQTAAGKHRDGLIVRPIIAVCNDLYASSLAKLRPHAEIIHYPRMPRSELITRLQTISRQENIPASTALLSEIVDAVDGDMRSCLNLLQGLGQGSGMSSKDPVHTWNQVSNRLLRKQQEFTDKREERQALQELVDSNGDYDKILMGCFHLYVRLHQDGSLRRHRDLGDWLLLAEMVGRGLFEHGQLAMHQSTPLMAFHHLFASSLASRSERAESDYKIYEQHRASADLLSGFMHGLSAQLVNTFNRQTCVLELAPYCLQIISPEVDSLTIVSSAKASLPSPNKLVPNKLVHTIQAMEALGTRFRKDRLADNGLAYYRLEPPLETLVVFDEKEQIRIGAGKYSVRQAINELAYRMNQTRAKTPASDTQSPVSEVKDKRPLLASQPVAKRARTFLAAAPVEHRTAHIERIWVQHVEGFSNAVRKDISWRDLWI